MNSVFGAYGRHHEAGSVVLQDRLANCGVPFLQAALHFLSDKLANGAVLPGSEGPLQVRASVRCCLAYQGPPSIGITLWTLHLYSSCFNVV